ncbi:molybdopterin-guanine dinucleotide biosynthesis protein MobC [Salmonella enterica]|nr:molybdopterin-guanine dinucleotide biosynthesis protein MobC [Salmonella enterica]EBU8671777.1 molybdopterin-guanine dinucleotide biosynthesis protein MobC [Salmonella enterica subsp. enterica serovar Panama]EEE1025206.1 molybdopterin-guanine dinucleotide biosynthesis protein MobC [Salmonella enterica subsp. enterica serovar Miami]EAV8252612.1 molybdopterin-guanine dinucleotide biosynthesis protein MobC [Salmonella enterica]EBH2659588.1 molybdopterin-guanine dinucleotide biosynthesis protein
MLLATNNERRERNHEKIRILLSFLKEETYSDFRTLMLLFEFKDHKSLYTLLNKVTKMGLVQKYTLESHASKIALWGITNDGLAVVLTPDDKIMPSRFEPYRITGWSLDHHLDNQQVRLILEKKGASNWINGDRSTFLSQYNVKHRPDGLIKLPDGRTIAVETERRLKTKARYQSIIASHLVAISDKHWRYVFYVTPDEQKKRSLKVIFSSITSVIVKNHHVTLETKHRDVFRIYTMEELKELELNNYA